MWIGNSQFSIILGFPKGVFLTPGEYLNPGITDSFAAFTALDARKGRRVGLGRRAHITEQSKGEERALTRG